MPPDVDSDSGRRTYQSPCPRFVIAADMTKIAMLELYKEGIIPHIQIHDELDLSIEDDAQAKKVIEIMEQAVSLEVPNKVDYEFGKNWGEING